MGIIGLGLVGGAGLFAVKYHQRTTNKFFSSLLTVSNDELSKIKYSYLSRGSMSVGVDKTPINDLALRDSFKALAVIGANRSGKTTFICNYILNGMFLPSSRTVFDRKSETSHNKYVAQGTDINYHEGRPMVCNE